MARINPVEATTASPEVQGLYEHLRRELKIEPNNFFKTMGHAPGLLKPMIEMSAVMLEGGKLDRRLKEWVILQIGRLNHCDYVYEAHKHALSRVIMGEVLDDRHQSLNTQSLSSVEKLAIRYAQQITENAVDDDTVKELRQCFSDEEVVELTVLASYYNFICRVANGLSIDMDALRYVEHQEVH